MTATDISPTDVVHDAPPAVAAQPAATEGLVVCPVCDALYEGVRPAHGEIARCQRCHHVLARPRARAGMQIISLAFATLVMMLGALFFPFLSIEAAGLGNAASVLDFALAFTSEELAALVIITAAAIVFIPVLRMCLLLYVLVPLVFDRDPAPHAKPALRLAEWLQPWSMAEIFALGCAVSLIKVSDLASVAFGPAFWMFGLVVLLVVMQQRVLCYWSIWDALTDPRR